MYLSGGFSTQHKQHFKMLLFHIFHNAVTLQKVFCYFTLWYTELWLGYWRDTPNITPTEGSTKRVSTHQPHKLPTSVLPFWACFLSRNLSKASDFPAYQYSKVPHNMSHTWRTRAGFPLGKERAAVSVRHRQWGTPERQKLGWGRCVKEEVARALRNILLKRWQQVNCWRQKKYKACQVFNYMSIFSTKKCKLKLIISIILHNASIANGIRNAWRKRTLIHKHSFHYRQVFCTLNTFRYSTAQLCIIHLSPELRQIPLGGDRGKEHEAELQTPASLRICPPILKASWKASPLSMLLHKPG